MTNSTPETCAPKAPHDTPVKTTITDIEQLREAENEGLAPIVPANPAVGTSLHTPV